MKEFTLDLVKNKILDRMLIGSVYDQIMEHTRYRDPLPKYRYNVLVSQKHRLIYYMRLKKKYLKKCTTERPWEALPKVANPNRIWFMWLQGLDEAPDVVKQCYKSLKKNIPDKEIVVIDEKNVFDYIELPDYIMEKYKKGIIGKAHFSDLIRLELLIKYGGYWIDSTILCTDSSMMKNIDKLDLFMYSYYYFGFNAEIMSYNNFFIYSTTNNNILCLEREFLHSYYKDYNRILDYFIFHLFLTIACEYYYREAYKIPIVSQVSAHVLATYIDRPFNENEYEILKSTTGFHKLSTRFNKSRMEKTGTFFDVVVRNGRF